jgi:hypothetical protein
MANPSRNGNKAQPAHRGRVQAQGGNTEKSEAWAKEKDDPPTLSEVLRLIDRLEGKLTRSEKAARAEAFQELRAYVQTMAAQGGLDAPVIKSFPRKKLKGGIRVDLEVITGRACVPDPMIGGRGDDGETPLP